MDVFVYGTLTEPDRVAEVLGDGESVLQEFRGEEPDELAEVLDVC